MKSLFNKTVNIGKWKFVPQLIHDKYQLERQCPRQETDVEFFEDWSSYVAAKCVAADFFVWSGTNIERPEKRTRSVFTCIRKENS